MNNPVEKEKIKICQKNGQESRIDISQQRTYKGPYVSEKFLLLMSNQGLTSHIHCLGKNSQSPRMLSVEHWDFCPGLAGGRSGLRLWKRRGISWEVEPSSDPAGLQLGPRVSVT